MIPKTQSFQEGGEQTPDGTPQTLPDSILSTCGPDGRTSLW